MIDTGASVDNFMRTLPGVLRGDKRASALAYALFEVLAKDAEAADLVRIYANIDALPEDILDILAHDFKVDWYDYNQTTEVKRRLIRDSKKVHRRLGTKAAVESVIRAYFGNGEVTEWFEYGGKPYFFRLSVDIDPQNDSPEARRQLFESVRRVKNVRSHLEAAYFVSETPFDTAVYVGAAPGARYSVTTLPQIWPDSHFAAEVYTGAAGSRASSTALPGGAEAAYVSTEGGEVFQGWASGEAGVFPLSAVNI
jgi:phage tail P2-like protein